MVPSFPLLGDSDAQMKAPTGVRVRSAGGRKEWSDVMLASRDHNSAAMKGV
jgi:hypothetical protein